MVTSVALRLISSFSQILVCNLPVANLRSFGAYSANSSSCLIPSHAIDETCVGILAPSTASANEAADALFVRVDFNVADNTSD